MLKNTLRARLAIVANTTAAVWAGVGLLAAGFAAIFYSWARVAGKLDVAEQLPYLVSGGIIGLALIIVGIGVADVAIRTQDRHERRHQVAQLDRALDELHDAVRDDRH